ncbi:hypothetical protein SEA_BBQVALINDRA_10 [Gordonia phage BBQValindra]|nr:hypothetical protein SEA_BBQVALINDRA_10 [Gordonia phage BBQValindra]
MSDIEFTLDRAGVGDILSSPEAHDLVNGLAGQMRDIIDDYVNDDPDDDIDVIVESYTSDRAAAAVTIAHPRGRQLQAEHGILTRAAAQVGLEVRSR